MQFFFALISFLIFYNSSITYSDQNYNIKPLKIKTFGKYDFDTLEKIKIPENFPTHRAMGREICKSSKGKTWSSSITFYLSKEMLWGVMAHSSSIRVYMSRKAKNNLDLTVYEAAKKWKDQKEWIKGYKVNTKVTNLTLSLKKGLKGVYNSPGGTYWHKCNINFDTINEAKDTLTKSSWITHLSNSQNMALHRMNIFGIKVSQKYDFEFNKSKLDEILVQNVKSNKLPEKKDNVSSMKTTYNLKPLKTKSFGNFNFDDLENVNIPDTFPTHKARGWEYCNTRKGKKWSNPITLYLSKDLVWGSMSGKDEIKIYMSSKIKNKLELSVYEAANEWEDTKDWIPGYEVKILNDNLEESLKKGVKGKYISSGGYWRVCKVIFNQIEKAKDVYKQSEWLDLITRSQRMGLIKMSNLGIKVSQKYNFKKLAIKLDKIKTAENERIKKIAEANKRATEIAEAKAKAKKLAEAKAKKLAEAKVKKLAEAKAKKLAEAKAKKLAEEKARKLADAKAKKLAEEKARKLAEKIKSMKSKAKDFYNDINSFVKSGADIDLIKLSNLYENRPVPESKWGNQEIQNFERLEDFMKTVDGFIAFEKNNISKRNIKLAKTKDKIITALNNNNIELKKLLRENFSNKQLSRDIQSEINKVQKFLSNQDDTFDVKIGNMIIEKSDQFLKNVKSKLKIAADIDNYLIDKKIVLEDILRNNFGNNKGKFATNLIKSIENANNLIDKQQIKNRIEKFLKKIQASNSTKTSSTVNNKNSNKSNSSKDEIKQNEETTNFIKKRAEEIVNKRLAEEKKQKQMIANKKRDTSRQTADLSMKEITGSLNADWKEIVFGVEGSVYYDENRYTKENDIITTWIKTNIHGKPRTLKGLKITSFVSRMKIDCNRKEYKELTNIVYDKKGNSKRVRGTTNWRTPKEGGTPEIVVDYMCKSWFKKLF